MTTFLSRAKVRPRHARQTRHTYASMMLLAGEPLLWVSSQMGHGDANVTLRRYARWIPSSLPDAGGRALAAWKSGC